MRKMTGRIVLMLTASLIATVALLPAPAQAVCTQVIYAERLFTDGATTQILGRTSSTSLILWFANTVDPEYARAIAAAVAQRNRVQLTGNAAFCPVVPATGFRFMGNLVFPNAFFISP